MLSVMGYPSIDAYAPGNGKGVLQLTDISCSNTTYFLNLLVGYIDSFQQWPAQSFLRRRNSTIPWYLWGA